MSDWRYMIWQERIQIMALGGNTEWLDALEDAIDDALIDAENAGYADGRSAIATAYSMGYDDAMDEARLDV